MKIKYYLSDILYLLACTLTAWSAKLKGSDFDEFVEEQKSIRKDYRKNIAFKW